MHRSFHRSRAVATLAAAAALAAALTACSGTSSPAQTDGGLTTLKVATMGLTGDGALITGIKKGFFAEEGLKIQTSIVANPPAGLAAAQSGQVDVAYAPSIPLLNALSQGVQLKVVAPADGYPAGASNSADPAAYDVTGLFASRASGITSVRQLKGKTVAVPARKAVMEVVIAQTLKDAGVDPASVSWVVLDFTSAVAALKNGTVDAAGLSSPFTAEASAQGSQQLATPSVDFFEEGAIGLWVSGSSTVSAKKKEIAEFQAAIKKSNAYADAHREEATQAGLDYSKSTLKLNEVKLPYWNDKVAQADLQRANEKMVSLGYLAKPAPLSDVIMAGAQ